LTSKQRTNSCASAARRGPTLLPLMTWT